ncbi:MAG: VCBS repeat-containing protein [Deltaproteobacteria bacterium]|nr:VCBS repeat-containing protein [Deltaproteobacteria bacterium]
MMRPTRRRQTALSSLIAAATLLVEVSASPAFAASSFPTYLACSVNVDATPSAIVSADFNHDGTPDVALADQMGSKVLVLLANSARFAVGDCIGAVQSLSINTGSIPAALAAGDLDANDSIDIAVAVPNGILLLRNNGMGQFTAEAQPIVACDSPQSVVIADVDGDGRADIVVGNGNGMVTLLYGKSGGFEAPTSMSADGAVTSLVVRDLNNDSFLDIATVSSGNNDLIVFLQRAGVNRRNFDKLAAVPAGSSPTAAVAADFNLDGDLDLAISSGGKDGMLQTYPGPGLTAGANATTLPSKMLVGPSGVAAGDLNRDSKTDVVVSNQNEATVSFFEGDGQGNLTEIPGPCTDLTDQRCRVQTGPRGVVLADVDGDGRDDVITANQDSNSITVLLSSNPPPTPTLTHTLPGEAATATPTTTRTPGGACDTTHADGRGCDDAMCQSCVCGIDPPCCDTSWDDTCVSRVANECAAACATPSTTPTALATNTPTATLPATETPTATQTATGSPPSTPTATSSPTQSVRPTRTPLATFTATVTETPTKTATNTRTATGTPGASATPTSVCFAAGVCVEGQGCTIDAAAAPRADGWLWLLIPAFFGLHRFGSRRWSA